MMPAPADDIKRHIQREERQAFAASASKKKKPRFVKPLPPSLAQLRKQDITRFVLGLELDDKVADEQAEGKELEEAAISITVPEPDGEWDKATGQPLQIKQITYVLQEDLNLDQLRALARKIGLTCVGSHSKFFVRRAIAIKKRIYDKFDGSVTGATQTDTHPLTELPPIFNYDDYFPDTTNIDGNSINDKGEVDDCWPPREQQGAPTSTKKKHGSRFDGIQETMKSKKRKDCESDDDGSATDGKRRRSNNNNNSSYSNVDHAEETSDDGSVSLQREQDPKHEYIGIRSRSSNVRQLDTPPNTTRKSEFKKMLEAAEFSKALLKHAAELETLGMPSDVVNGMKKQAANTMRGALSMPTAEALL